MEQFTENTFLQNKTVVLGVSGGIAAYKVPELVRLLRKAGAQVQVIMTRSAREFVTPLTFQTVSNNPVTTAMFAPMVDADIAHVSVADKADLLVIAPATANVIAKLAAGVADDFLSTAVLATRAPILLAPAMNVNMWNNPATQENISTLKKRGILTVGPEKGELACGWEGMGRMAEVDTIFQTIVTLMAPKDLQGERILITAGPTREPIDPVRFLSNRSSGKMGYAIARAAHLRGATVTLITGPTSLTPPEVEVIPVQTANEMFDETIKRYRSMDTVIMAAAVSDFRPAQQSPSKVKKKEGSLTLELAKNPDILECMGKEKGSTFLVGFAAETDDVLTNAKKKIAAKNIDLMVANDITKPGAGFESDSNIVTLITPQGEKEELPQLSKEGTAHKILDKVVSLKAHLR